MKNTILNPFSYIINFFRRHNLKKSNNRKMLVHYRRDLDALGEYIKI